MKTLIARGLVVVATFLVIAGCGVDEQYVANQDDILYSKIANLLDEERRDFEEWAEEEAVRVNEETLSLAAEQRAWMEDMDDTITAKLEFYEQVVVDSANTTSAMVTATCITDYWLMTLWELVLLFAKNIHEGYFDIEALMEFKNGLNMDDYLVQSTAVCAADEDNRWMISERLQ